MPKIELVRVYDARPDHPAHDTVADATTGEDRPSVFLVDRVWPRGVAKKDLPHDVWLKDVGPSTELRKWFGHDPDKFDEFSRRYRDEIEQARDVAQPLLDAAKRRDVVLLYSAKDERHNQAVVLRQWLNEKR